MRGTAGERGGANVPGSGTPGATRAPSRPHEGAQIWKLEAPAPVRALAVPTAGFALAAGMGQAAAVPHPVACIGHEAVPQQDFAGARAGPVADPRPSRAAHTGDSVMTPGASAARIRSARTKARIERITPPSYTMVRDRIHFVLGGSEVV